MRVPPALQALSAQLLNPAWCAGAACVAGQPPALQATQLLPGVWVPPALQASHRGMDLLEGFGPPGAGSVAESQEADEEVVEEEVEVEGVSGARYHH